MISTDHPIKEREQDQLKRHPLARRVSEIILRHDDENRESFVVGVDGAWGSGKSSFVNLIKEELGEQVITVNFNPWLFSDHVSLIQSFFTVFSETIRSSTGKRFFWTMGGLKKYGKIVANADLGLPFFVKIPISLLDLFDGGSLDKQREKINNKLCKLNKKILIIIDDIDRLDPDETKLIFKIIKSSANFKNTIFLIAYDRVRVSQQLTNKDTGFDGSEYLKKIIQVNFLLPDPEPEELWELFFADLNQILKNIYGTDDVDEKRWSELFHGGLSTLFKTLRDVKSFINSLELDWSIMGGNDVSPVDFIGVEAIRVFAPEFYGHIAGNEAFFTGEHTPFASFRKKEEIEARNQKYQEIMGTIPKTMQPSIDGICRNLFPQLNDHFHISDERSGVWRKDKRVCSKEKFRFYFKLGIPKGSISEIEIKGIVKSLKNKIDFYKNLKQFEKEKKLHKILNRLLDYLKSLTPQMVENLVLAVWQIQEENKDPRNSVWEFDDLENSCERITYHAILNNIKKQDRVALLTDLIKRSKQFYAPLTFARILIHEYSKDPSNMQALITTNGIEEIKKVGLDKIRTVVASGELRAHPKMISLLYAWRDFGGEENMHQYINGLTGSKQGVLELIGSSVRTVLSSAGNYEDIGREDLFGLCPEEDLKKKVAEITDEDLTSATKEQKKGIQLFRNPAHRWSVGTKITNPQNN